MDKRIIFAPPDARWLSNIPELNNELPINCLFDKGITGCGGTELALRNDVNTIITVPTVNLIHNKTTQHGDNVLGVYEGVKYPDIYNYISGHTKMKIMVTYDSLPRLIDTIDQYAHFNPYRDFQLIVDEWHVLFNWYVFKKEAIRGILEEAPKFNAVTYMTATPIEQKYLFPEFKNLPIVEVIWPNAKKIKLTSQPTNNPLKSICKEIEKVIDGKMSGNLHIFVNSVDFIIDVVKEMGLTSNQVKIVCSDNKNPGSGKISNQKKLNLKLGEDYKIEKPLDTVKVVNLYTSTVFVGCDIIDPIGRTYIISEGHKQHTLLDIHTQLIQICGRLRNTVFSDITHIFSYTRYNAGISLEEFEEETIITFDKSKKLVDEYNQTSENLRQWTLSTLAKNVCNEKYISAKNNKLFLDENLRNIDIVNFKIVNGIYSNRIAYIEELKKNNIEVDDRKYNYHKSADMLMKNSKAKISFKEIFEDYVQLQSKKSEEAIPTEALSLINNEILLIDMERPLVGEAYHKLGIKRVEELNHHVGNINTELIKISDISETKKIKELIMDRIGHGVKEDSFIKQAMQSIFKDLNIKKKAKATSLDDYFDTKCYIKNGKRSKMIIRDKIIYGQSNLIK